MYKRSDERKLTRLQGYDYSQNGYYFVTICIEDMEHRFGYIENGKMILNKFGNIAQQCLNDLPNNHKNCFLDETIIMPNHIHCIIIIDNDIPIGDDFLSSPFPKTHTTIEMQKQLWVKNQPLQNTKPKPNMEFVITGDGNGFGFQGDGKKPSPTKANKTHGLSEMVRSFKHYVTRNFNEINPNTTFKWQRSFNDHIIRNEKELYAIRQYIIDNPLNW
ncbi:MAG: hypothetical protein PF638_05660 [Candidatus Delongbacteria bacterium]|jgi:putative transposase|nr:hypothetical protein [Candidatus Delongbacteria bacterium]